MQKNTSKEYALALYEATHGKTAAEISKVVENFTALLAKKGLLKQSSKIIAEFEKHAKKEAGVVSIQITSARELDAHTITEIEKNFGENVESTTKIDPSILGGVTIKTADKIFDASVKTQLQRLKQKLS